MLLSYRKYCGIRLGQRNANDETYIVSTSGCHIVLDARNVYAMLLVVVMRLFLGPSNWIC